MNSRVCHTVRDGGTGKKGEKGIGACVGKKSGNEIIYCLKKKKSCVKSFFHSSHMLLTQE